jgi:hypothetical protein
MIRKKVLRFCLAVAFTFAIHYSFAQPPDGGPPAPIFGIEFLIAGGALLGIKRIFSSAKKK